MSLVTFSKTNSRVYERRFDHEEAQRLRAEDPRRWTYPALAERYGVSIRAVERVCRPSLREDMDRRVLQWARNNREPCLGGCGRLVWTHQKGRSGFCTACVAALRASADVRDGELRCTQCREWKPDEEFYSGGAIARRGRKQWCKSCDNAARREHRKTHRDQERATWRNYKRTKSKESRMGDFIVLQKDESGYLKECGRITAVSRLHAVEQIASGPGEYIAVKPDSLEPLRVEETIAFKVVKNGAAPE